MPVDVVVLAHPVTLVEMVVLVVLVVDGQVDLVELLIQILVVDRVYQHLQKITDKKKVLMEYLDLVVEEVAEVTAHLMEEMVVLA